MAELKNKFAALAACILLQVSHVCALEDVAVSTKAAKPRKEENPLMLNIVKDRYDSRVGLDYSIRWDFSDLKNFRPGLKTLADSLEAVRGWDITENTRFKYYGFSTNPWRLVIAREKTGGRPAGAGTSIKTEGAPSAYKKRLRISFSPLVDDIKRDLDENLRLILLESSFSGLSPEWRKVSRQNKKIFVNDVLSLDIWNVPGLKETGKGLKYIGK